MQALAGAITYAKQSLPTKALYLFSVDRSSGRVSHNSVVGKDLVSRGLRASEWAKAVTDVIGGKVSYIAEYRRVL